jgi:dephospho-CoA kinase
MIKKVFGLTGGISSGKTTLSEILRNKYPDIEVFNCDLEAKEILNSDEIKSQLKLILGSGIELNNKIDFKKVAKIIFNDELKKKKVEELIHPKVWGKLDSLVKFTKEEKIILVESAILVDIGKDKEILNIIVTVCDLEERKKRLRERNGWSDEEINERIKNQTDENVLKEKANVIVNTDCSLDELRGKAEKVYKYLINPVKGKLIL